MATEGVFGLLKGRWTVLVPKCDSDKTTEISMILTCVILHKLYIRLGDTIPRHVDIYMDDVRGRWLLGIPMIICIICICILNYICIILTLRIRVSSSFFLYILFKLQDLLLDT